MRLFVSPACVFHFPSPHRKMQLLIHPNECSGIRRQCPTAYNRIEKGCASDSLKETREHKSIETEEEERERAINLLQVEVPSL